MRRMMASVLQVVGLALVVVGAVLFSPIAGFIVGGLVLALVGLVLERPDAS